LSSTSLSRSQGRLSIGIFLISFVKEETVACDNNLAQLNTMASETVMTSETDNDGAIWEWFDLELATASVDTGEASMADEEILGASVTGEERLEASASGEERLEASASGGERLEASEIEEERLETAETAGLRDMPPPSRASGLKRKVSAEGDGRGQLPRHAPLMPPWTSTTPHPVAKTYTRPTPSNQWGSSPSIQPWTSTTTHPVANTYTRPPPSNQWGSSPSLQPWTSTTTHPIANAYSRPPHSNQRHPALPLQPWVGMAAHPSAAAYPGPPASNQRPQAASLQPWTGTTAYPIAATYPGPATSNLSHQVAQSSSLASMPQGSTTAAPYSIHPYPISIHFEIWIRPHFAREYFFGFVEGSTYMTVMQFWDKVKGKMNTVKDLDEMKRMHYIELKVRCLNASIGSLSETVKDIVILNRTEKEERKWINLMQHAISRIERGETVTVDALFQPYPD